MDRIVVAADVGAGSVKLVAAGFDGTAIRTLAQREAPNDPVPVLGSLYVDIFGIYGAIRGFQAEIGAMAGAGACASLGIDSYGNGYGFVDPRGRLLGLPRHYRDPRTLGVLEAMRDIVPMEEVFRETGVYPLRYRVLMQLFTEATEGAAAFSHPCTFLPLPDLLTFMFTGDKAAEATSPSVGSLLEAGRPAWNSRLMERLGIPSRIFPAIVGCGTEAGLLYGSDRGGVDGTKVFHVAGHDTESALLTLPDDGEPLLFASIGTSVVFGMRTAAPVVSREAFDLRFKNIAGAFGENSLCRDFPGLRILARCMEAWEREGRGIGYADLEGIGSLGLDNRSYLDLGDDAFAADGQDMPAAVARYCRDTGQRVPENREETALCIMESIALEMKRSLGWLCGLAGMTERAGLGGSAVRTGFTRLRAVGGGTRNAVLMQLIADALGIRVLAGSPVASSMGNVLVQLMASGDLGSRKEMADAAEASVRTREYRPAATSKWDDAAARMRGRNAIV